MGISFRLRLARLYWANIFNYNPIFDKLSIILEDSSLHINQKFADEVKMVTFNSDIHFNMAAKKNSNSSAASSYSLLRILKESSTISVLRNHGYLPHLSSTYDA